MDVLLVNSILYLLYTIYYVRRTSLFTIHNLISAWFTLVALVGYFTVLTGIYQNVHGELNSLSYIPYIIAFAAFIILMWPLRVINGYTLTLENFPKLINSRFEKYMVIMLAIFTILLFMRMYVVIYVMKMDSTTAYLLAQTEGSVYKYGAVEAWIVGFLSTFYNILNPLMLYYCIVQFIFNKGTINKKFYYSIILFVFIVLLYNISQGARGGIFISTINLCVVFLPFWKNIQLRIKRKLLKGGILFLVLSGMYTITMTISRFLDNSSKETPLGSFFRYIGEPFPHLGNKFWDQVIIHPLGSRFYPFIFGQHFSEAKYITTNAENQAVWGSITGVPILNYKTIYGDFYIEFGPIIGFIFIIFYAGLFRCFIHRNKISFAMVPLLYYYIDMYVSAPLLFGKWGYANVRELFIIIALYFFMRLFKIGNNYTI